MFEKKVLKNGKSFIIAEIGHNHQGSLDTAINMIKIAKECGADAVKLQKRDNKALFTKQLYNELYDNKNSYADTYGEHREKLEFGKEEYRVLSDYSKELGVHFFATPFDFESVDFLSEFDMPAYKVASADLINTPLLKYIAETGKPIILSTGGGTISDIKRACDIILPLNDNLTILHCTASYPAVYTDMNLNVIPELIKEFPDHVIGLSDHENGIHAASIAYMLGARVFEKHFTLNRSWKGTDQSFSLEPDGLRRLVRNLNRIPELLGNGRKELIDSEKKPLKKMAKSIVASQDLSKGHKVTEKDISLKSPSGGLPPYEYDNIIGKILNKDILHDGTIMFDDID